MLYLDGSSSYNPLISLPNEGWNMNRQGSIRCTTCNTGIPEDTGVCPKCKKWGHVYIDVYWSAEAGGDGGHYPVRRDENNKRLDYGTAWNLRKQIQSEIQQKKFKPYKYLPAERNPHRCEVFFDRWLAEVKATLSPGTYDAYKSTVDAHLRGYWGKKDIADGTGNKQLKAWVYTLQKTMRKHSARATRNRFHAFLSWAAEEGIIENIAHFKKIKGNDEKRKYAFTLEQQFRIVDKIGNQVIKRAVLLLMLTGMREGEGLTLKASDVDIPGRSITVNRTWSGKEIKEATKTDEPRKIPLPALAVQIIVDCIGDRIGDVWLFPRKDGKLPYHYRQLWKAWNATGSPATLRDATRRSYATILKNAGVDIEKIRELLGHSTSKTTRIYLEDEPMRLLDEVDEIQGKLLKFRNESETNRNYEKPT
jgi:integrase